MSKIHLVSQGDCMSSIARQYHFVSWKALYDHPANADLKARRPNPNALVPGDRVVIPDPVPMSKQCAIGAWHEMRSKGEPTTLRIQLRDMQGNSFANVPYTFEIGSEVRDGTTDGDGVLTEIVDPELSRAIVKLRPNPDEPDVLQWQLKLGGLDDASAVTGAQGRLKNLGFYSGPASGQLDDETRLALRLFQRASGLNVTERLDAATVDQLTAMHDKVT